MGNLIKLVIKNLQLYSYHGVTSEEQQLGGRYEIDAELYYNGEAAISTDNLHKAVNYAEVLTCIDSVVHAKRRRLIETLAHDIAQAILQRFTPIESVCVRVRKRTIPVGMMLDSVEVEWRMHRQS